MQRQLELKTEIGLLQGLPPFSEALAAASTTTRTTPTGPHTLALALGDPTLTTALTLALALTLAIALTRRCGASSTRRCVSCPTARLCT